MKTQLRKWIMAWRHLRHFVLRGVLGRGMLTARYLRQHPIAKLHLSAGERYLDGWLNTDLFDGDIYLDATQLLPFGDAKFQAIYSHHFIEHVTPDRLQRLLAECHRVLSPTGRIRLVTPDLPSLIAVYQGGSEDLITNYSADAPVQNACGAFNTLVFNGREHFMIYDFDTLADMMRKAGFRNITQYAYANSDDPVFDSIDDHGYDYIDTVSLCVEADK